MSTRQYSEGHCIVVVRLFCSEMLEIEKIYIDIKKHLITLTKYFFEF